MRASYEETCALVSEPTTTLSAHKDIRTSWPPLHPPSLSISLSLSLSLVLSLCLWGIAHSSLQKRHQVRSARVRRNTIFDNSAPLAKYSAHILVPPPRQTPAQCGFSRSHLLVICAAKPRYTAAAAREHRRVLAPRLPTPGASATSPLHNPREVLFEMCQRRVLLARIQG